MRRIALVLTFVIAASMAAFADLPKPDKSSKPNTSIDTNLRINLKSDVKDARLIIPKALLVQLQAQLDQPGNGSDSAAAFTISGVSKIQTIVGGLFLSFAIVFGGIWFARSGKLGTKTSTAMVIFAVLAGLGSAATFVYGNMGPPAEARKVTGKMFSDAVHQYKFGSGPIKLETTAEGEDVYLIVPDPKDPPKGDE